MHEGVDLQLRVVEGVWSRLHHVTIHHLAHARVQRHLQPEEVSRQGGGGVGEGGARIGG